MIKTLGKSVREYKRTAVLSPIFITLEVIIECIIPFLMAAMVDRFEAEGIPAVLRYGLPLIGLAVLSLICGVLAARFSAKASCGFAKNLRHDMFYALQDFSFADVDKFSTSSLVTRMTTDVTNVQNAFQMLIRIAFRAPLMIIFSAVMGFMIHKKLAWVFIAMLPVLLIALGLIAGKVFPFFRRIFKKYDALNNSVQENVSGIRVVKAFAREDYEKKKFDKASTEVKNDFTKAERIMSLNSPVMMFCIYVAILIVSVLGAKIIVQSGGTALSAPKLSSLIGYGAQILSSLMMVSMVFVMLAMAGESARRIAEVLEHKPTMDENKSGETVVADGSVSFRNVSFKYSKDASRYALSGINLEIASGQTVGILGGTGSSKTTLVQLIPRLYDVTEGSLMVGGKDVRDYNLTALRDSVAVVLQKNVLFSGTIKENLRWGNPCATDEEIVHACKLSQADEFISQFPDGYDTYIEQGGINVSGGQKQRLCIARALLKKPKILILDDSTSAVDTRTDAYIRKAFSEEIPDTTKIIIAQRVSSVQNADIILVMDNGRITDMGTHEELLASSAIYREVYESQTQATKVEGGNA
ncbi:MAG: ABC transporter ATP-binding protein [Clostridia bacterium]|nr:ABC transporter ATP-binding protein [Clostridia bacterium]